MFVEQQKKGIKKATRSVFQVVFLVCIILQHNVFFLSWSISILGLLKYLALENTHNSLKQIKYALKLCLTLYVRE